jgi:hypothetical protein
MDAFAGQSVADLDRKMHSAFTVQTAQKWKALIYLTF